MVTFTPYKSRDARWLYEWMEIEDEFWYDYGLQRRCILLETHSETLLIWRRSIKGDSGSFRRLFHQIIIWYLQGEAQIVWFIQGFKQLVNFLVYGYITRKGIKADGRSYWPKIYRPRIGPQWVLNRVRNKKKLKKIKNTFFR